MKTGAVNGII